MKWNNSPFDEDTSNLVLDSKEAGEETASPFVQAVNDILTDACGAATPRRSTKRKRACSWCNEEIHLRRNNGLKYWRKVQRSRGRSDFESK